MKFISYISGFMIPFLLFYVVGYGLLSKRDIYSDFLGEILGKVTSAAGIPPQIVPLGIVRLFSSSAATGLLLDIFKEFGTDSPVGLMAGLMLSSTESVFYCMSVYFGSVQIEKTRYTLAGALLASLAGIIASVILAHLLV